MDTRVRYFYLRDVAGSPVGCIAAMYFAKAKCAKYGVSTRNPQDRFDRKVARELAAGRLAIDPAEVDLTAEETINYHTITRHILKDVLTLDHHNAKTLNQLEQERQEKMIDELVSLDAMIKKMDRQRRELEVKRNRLQNHLQELQGYDQIPARAKKAARRWLRKNEKIEAEIKSAQKAVTISGGAVG